MGALIKGLRERGLEDRTLFVIFGNHGPFVAASGASGGLPSSSLGLGLGAEGIDQWDEQSVIFASVIGALPTRRRAYSPRRSGICPTDRSC